MASFPSHILATTNPASPDDLVPETATFVAFAHEIHVAALAVLPRPLYIPRGLAILEVDFEQDLTQAVTGTMCVYIGRPLSYCCRSAEAAENFNRFRPEITTHV